MAEPITDKSKNGLVLQPGQQALPSTNPNHWNANQPYAYNNNGMVYDPGQQGMQSTNPYNWNCNYNAYGNTAVVVTQPQPPPTPAPQGTKILAIISILFILPIGIVSYMTATKAEREHNSGNVEKAAALNKKSKILSVISIIVGSVLSVVVLVYYFLFYNHYLSVNYGY